MSAEVSSRIRASQTRGAKRMSKSRRAGLTLSVSKIAGRMKQRQFTKRISASAPIFATGLIEYLLSETITMASEQATAMSKKRLTPAMIKQGIEKDKDFSELFRGINIASGGVVPKPSDWTVKNVLWGRAAPIPPASCLLLFVLLYCR